MTQDTNPWHGRNDAGEQGDTRRLFQIVQTGPLACQANEAVVLGFASDAGVRRNQGRPGARLAPHAIRRMMAGLPAHDLSVLWDAGDIPCEGDALEQAQAKLGDQVGQILDTGARLVVLGGGHEMAWGSFQGLHAHLSNQDQEAARSILIINLDAHFDLRTSRPGSSGTPFDQILAFCGQQNQPVTYAVFGISRLGNTAGLFQHAKDLGVFYIEDTDMQERHLDARLADLNSLINQADHIYLTIDLDCLPAAVAPGVSAPAAFGIPMTVVEAVVRHVKASGKLRLADLAEMNPEYDIDQHTARLAARLAWTLLAP
ncbi:formimidoylglutamase [Castellaniella sp.]|uniref:formimidoylglutamase n=1 Tax=Castellaniella sp. TaxID=1955812 RepID=UPI002B000B1B|nr:formimidoylglutamase [Castellaniella sp.]